VKEKRERWDLKETRKREVEKKARREKQALSLALLLLLGNRK
jgi:hypothetical protein